MTQIIQLTDDVIAKIAAGEVIERPAYAVKELIENALDAGASAIDISLLDSGLKRIVVKDNGEGMTDKDLHLCFLPHTTSKIKSDEDLIGVKTLGFRGEALSSIAAISQMSILTRRHTDPGGSQITLDQGTIKGCSQVGTPPGTIITVDNLFANIPAREKFLKSSKSELKLITEIVSSFALAYPDVAFSLMNNSKMIFDFSTKQTLTERIKLVLGDSDAAQLIQLSYEDGFINLSGFIGKPQAASKRNYKQYIFVNKRTVTDRMLQQAVKEGFGTLLPATSTPIFLLSVTLPPEIVDVNIHPRKEQIGIIKNKELYDVTKYAVNQLLSENNITFNLARFKYESSARLGETTSFAGTSIKESVLPWDRNQKITLSHSTSILQIHLTYILSQTSTGIFLVDQHAAHERIIYEKLVTSFKKEENEKRSRVLPRPIPLSLSLQEIQLFEYNEEYFKKLGFVIEHFQGSSYIVRSVPIVFAGRKIEKIIKDILTDLDAESVPSIDDKTQRMLAFLACRAAIKAGDVLSIKDMNELLLELEKTSHNITCPHGRPTRISITISEINHLFKR